MAHQYLKMSQTSAESAQKAAIEALSAGGLVILPTETVYGCLCRLDRPEAVKRVRQLRPTVKAMTLHVGRAEQASRATEEWTAFQAKVARRLWPGPVGLVFEVSKARQTRVAAELQINPADLYAGAKVTARCPAHVLTRQVLESCDFPVAGVLPADEASRVDILPEQTLAQVDLVIDDGSARLGKPSTIVNAGRESFDIVRTGVYDRRIIEKLLQTTILFVCSGNTCRSPMAEAIARKVLADHLKVGENELEKAGYQVISAGASAASGSPATSHAVEAVKQFGGDLAKHRSRALTQQLVDNASVIFAMGKSHREVVKMISPSAASKVTLLDEQGDIDDPIGGDIELYRKLAAKIKAVIEQRLKDKSLLGLEKQS